MSEQLELSLAIGDYDHTRDLVTGAVAPTECKVQWNVVAKPEETFTRFLAGEWDAAEMSMAVATALRSRGDDSLLALPIFPARSFRHGAIFVGLDGPSEPEQLNGARVGIPVWLQTAGIYVRGLLAEDYGVDLKSITWVQAGVNEPGREEPVPFEQGDFQITARPDSSLNELLLSGEVDAVISARPPVAAEEDDPRIGRLFPSPVGLEMKYAKTSGIFPIMHVLVVRKEVYARNPAIADDLIRAFTEAKDNSLERALAQTVPSYPLPWSASNARRAQELIGADFWPYGIDANRKTLDTFVRYCADQGVLSKPLRVDELFSAHSG